MNKQEMAQRIAELENRVAELEHQSWTKPIPAGKYLARCVDVDCKISRANNRPYWQLTFVVLTGAYKGHKLWYTVTVRFIGGPLGSILNEFDLPHPVDFDAANETMNEMIGKECRLDVRVRDHWQHKGEKMNEVHSVEKAR